MTTDSTAMAIAEKRARSARKTLEESRRTRGQADKDAVTVVSGEDEKSEIAKAEVAKAEERSRKPPLGYRIRLLLCGALVALAVAAGAFFAFRSGDRGPSDGFDGTPASAQDVGAPTVGFDPRP